MKNMKVNHEVQRFVEKLPHEKNFLIKYNYIFTNPDDKIIGELTRYHIEIKDSESILGRMIEMDFSNKSNLHEITFFEIISVLSERICLPLSQNSTVKIQFLQKDELFHEILPILNGKEISPFKVFK
jgi:hypothetical protein